MASINKTQMTGSTYWKRESLEPRNLILFFIIAFGWSWTIWFGIINEWIPIPQDPNLSLIEFVKFHQLHSSVHSDPQ